MTNTSDAIADHDLYAPYTNTDALLVYRAVFQSNTRIADAMGYSALPLELREDIWQKFDEAESNNGVLDIANPAATPPNQHATPASPFTALIALTQSEALDSYSSKVAHAFWLEVNKVFPWSILSYDLESCQGLFDPAEVFYSWDVAGPTYAELGRICDHSPKRAYDQATPLLATPRGPTAAVAQFLWHGSQFLHSSGSTTIAGWDPNVQSGHILTMDQVTANGTSGVGNNYSTSTSKWISRGGCHCMSIYQAALARSVNIPSKDIHGWVAPVRNNIEARESVEFTGHHTNWYPSLPKRRMEAPAAKPDTGTEKGLVLFHGDDVYLLEAYEGSNEARALQLLMNYSWYKQYSLGQGYFEREKSSDEFYAAQRLGIPDMLYVPSYTVDYWESTQVNFGLLPASELPRIAQARTHVEGSNGDVPEYDYTKMVWPVGKSLRREQLLSIGAAVNLPAGVQDGDLILFAFACDSTAVSSSVAPAGFTHVSGSPYSGCGSTTLIVMYKIAASEGSSIAYGALSPTSFDSAALVVVLRNADQAAPIGLVATGCDVSASASTYIDAPLLAPTDEDEWYQVIIAAEASKDLGTACQDATDRAVTLPRAGYLHDYFELTTDAPTVDVSLVALGSPRRDKATATGVWMNGTTRTTTGVPYMSIQIRRTP